MRSSLSKGFTFIELLIVIAILGAMATFVVLSFTGTQQGARDTRRKSDLKQYQAAFESYANRNNGLYPVSVSASLPSSHCTASVLNVTGCTTDPTAGQSYQYITNGSGSSYILWATLEKRQGAISYYFVVCSSGTSGRVPTTGAGSWTPSANCPATLIP